MTAATPVTASETTYETVHVERSKKAWVVVRAVMAALSIYLTIFYLVVYYRSSDPSEDNMKENASDLVIDPERLRCAAENAVAALKLLANPERLLLLCQLSQGEYSVSELEAQLDIHQPTLSQQLGVLRSQGVVATRREGKNIYYSVADPNLLEILVVLYRL